VADITWRPLTEWPKGRPLTPDFQREDARFARGEWKSNVTGDPNSGSRYTKTRTPLSTTLDELDRELTMIGASAIVGQLDMSERSLRVDGRLRADAVAKSPPVVLTFTRKKVPYVFACDHFRRWQDNLRAIALGLEALRKVERYHIAQAGDQYRGWTALPASTTTAFTTEQAAACLARLTANGVTAADIVRDVDVARKAYRHAAANTHPDNNGSTGNFQLVQEAKRVLGAHFGAVL
jgi:hypothetical protein